MEYLLFLIGFILLWKGADYFIDGGIKLASILGVSPLFIGLSIAAVGTSAPEAAVSINAAVINHSTISFGNILGSNIANIGLVIGLSALLFTISGKSTTIKKEIPYSLFITIVLLFLLRDDWFGGNIQILTRLDGFILIVFFILYLFYLYHMAISDRRKLLLDGNLKSIRYSKKETLKTSLLTTGGIVGVLFGAKLVVDNAVKIALSLGISETMISVTIIALGTSLPEMATSIQAARKGESDIALGNIVGSNLFNILFVLGVTSIIKPIQFSLIAFPDLIIVVLITVILLIFIFTGRIITRREGVILLLFYLFYIVFVIFRR
jgi:cation:H+ antiporter